MFLAKLHFISSGYFLLFCYLPSDTGDTRTDLVNLFIFSVLLTPPTRLTCELLFCIYLFHCYLLCLVSSRWVGEVSYNISYLSRTRKIHEKFTKIFFYFWWSCVIGGWLFLD